jgi:glycosyltransferase involved in cell wall biosynthesis
MYRGCCTAVVMPAFNVEAHLAAAIDSVPPFVDHLVVVDDGSTDGTPAVLDRSRRPGLVRLRHAANRGVGAAIATGYKEAARLGAEVIAVMAGDGQMDPDDLSRVLEPVVCGEADYAKGNRFLHRDVWRVMPSGRLVGNITLSLLTKVTSGYWTCFDSQCGYTAISRTALRAINGRMFARYGYPNDILARLRTAGTRVKDVQVRPIYEGQPSGIRLRTVVYPVLFVLLRSMGRRIWRQRLLPLLSTRALETTRIEPTRTLTDADRSSEHLLPAPTP